MQASYASKEDSGFLNCKFRFESGCLYCGVVFKRLKRTVCNTVTAGSNPADAFFCSVRLMEKPCGFYPQIACSSQAWSIHLPSWLNWYSACPENRYLGVISGLQVRILLTAFFSSFV